MDDFTKIKLINSLIDAVNHFYDLKQKAKNGDQRHLKGFCEGLAYALVEIRAIDSDEAKKILQGLGKKREPKEEIKESVKETKKDKEPEEKKSKEVKEEKKMLEPDNLEIPTIFRKNKN